MKKFNKQDSPRKRISNELLCKLMAMRLSCKPDACNAVLLSGPNIRAQINEIKPLSKGTGKILFVDYDEKTYKIAKRKFNNLPPHTKGRVKVCYGDIWEEILCAKHKFSYIDYDYCFSSRSLLANGFIDGLVSVMKRKRLAYIGWLKVTTSCRGTTRFEDNNLANGIKTQFNRFGYNCSREYNHTYSDGASMRTQCFLFSKGLL